MLHMTLGVFTWQPGTHPTTVYPGGGAQQPVHMTDQRPGYPLSIDVHMRVRDTSEVGLAPPITLVYCSQKGANQCLRLCSIYITRVHFHKKMTEADPKSRKIYC